MLLLTIYFIIFLSLIYANQNVVNKTSSFTAMILIQCCVFTEGFITGCIVKPLKSIKCVMFIFLKVKGTRT